MTPAVVPPMSTSSNVIALRRRIGWICQSIRWAALAYLGWILWMTIRFWTDAGVVQRVFSYRTGMTLTEPSGWQRLAGFGVSLIDLALVAGAVFAVWKMMEEYLAGRIFQQAATTWLRRVGLVALAFDIVARPVVALLASAHMPGGGKFTSLFFQPSDLLNGMFLLAFVALAHIFKSAADLADENAQFV